MRRHIPNLLTLGNLVCGSIALYLVMEGHARLAVLLLFAAAVFDFLDGGAARLLGATSETGKQLDSLSDMVSFGLLPAFFILDIFRGLGLPQYMLAGVLVVPLFSAIRLARFNTTEDGHAFFSGLPTPAHALFWAGMYWSWALDGTIFGRVPEGWFLWAIMLAMALYMILPFPMYTLKFSHFRLRGNLVRYLLIVVGGSMLVLAGPAGLPLVVLFYMLVSLINLLLSHEK